MNGTTRNIVFIIVLAVLLFPGCSQPDYPVITLDEVTFEVPEWAYDAVWYQIFPERFANGDPDNDPPNVEPWGGAPTYDNFFGGDLQGVIDNLWYLEDLGVNAIYFNPIFKSLPNHKYHTTDYYKIDPHFGTEETFRTLLDEAHTRGIRIIIDGVFNHTGPDFWAFEDIIENEEKSEYLHWYDVHDFPVRIEHPPNYEAWWGLPDLPKLMTTEPDVKEYLFDVTRYWTEFGIDGWRLDVPNEVPHEFWIEWRPIVREANPDAFIVGELWEDASPWLQGDQFDATMNYRFRNACIEYFLDKSITTKQFNDRLYAVFKDYPSQVNYVNQNLVGSHDTERYMTRANLNTDAVKLTAILKMTHVGAPMIYYGDEIGMEGEDDPDCRRTMIWNEEEWNSDLRDLFKELIRIRHENPALRRGSFQTKVASDKRNLFVFERRYGENVIVVVLNNDTIWQDVWVPDMDKGMYVDLLTGIEYDTDGHRLWVNDVGPYSGKVLLKK
jgi:cyclomaltodextrinase / maltogenic alpha-amylase / neopullulanase